MFMAYVGIQIDMVEKQIPHVSGDMLTFAISYIIVVYVQKTSL